MIGSSRGNVEVNIKDNVSIDTATRAGTSDIAGGCDIGGGNLPGREVVVNIDGGKHGKVKIGENRAILGSIYGAISGTKVNIGDNVLLKMRQSGWSTDAKYINVNNVEAAVGTRSDDPTASGLVNTIGDNTELWYINNGDELQKIVHGKNLCKKVQNRTLPNNPPALNRALQIVLATMSIRTEQPAPVVTAFGQIRFLPWAMIGTTGK